jgi:hypothetical protein
MARYDYEKSRQLIADDVPFHALIMAAMRKADSQNLATLRVAFPETWDELETRYHAPAACCRGSAEHTNPAASHHLTPKDPST